MTVFTGQHLAATRGTNFKKVRGIIKTLKASCRHQAQMYSKLDARVDPLFKERAALEAEVRRLSAENNLLKAENQRCRTVIDSSLYQMKLITGEVQPTVPNEDDI